MPDPTLIKQALRMEEEGQRLSMGRDALSNVSKAADCFRVAESLRRMAEEERTVRRDTY